jgi:predicted ATPase
MSELALGFRSLPLEFQNVILAAQERYHLTVTPLQVLGGGFSGASIYLVSVAFSLPQRVEHYILKLDRKNEKSKIDEVGRFQLAIDKSPPDFAGQHIARMAFDRIEQEGAIAIFYSIAGQSLNQYRTLSSYEQQSQVGTIFAATFDYILDKWNENPAIEQAVHPQAVLEQWLGFRIKPGNNIEEFLISWCRLQPDITGFLVHGNVLPNPLAYASNIRLWGDARPIDILSGLQHGDLNTNNILAKFSRNSEALEGYYLIDFAMFKAGMPLIYDLRYLEMSYLILRRTQVSLEKLLDLIGQLGEADRVDSLQLPVDVAGTGAVIASTRDTFEHWIGENHPSLHDDLWGQYWLAGVAAGLSYCHKPGLPDEDRLVGLAYAAANLKRYSALFDIPTPSEGQRLYDAAGLNRDGSFLTTFPSTARKPLDNLPAQPTPFIGRQAQVAAARKLISSETVRLVTFTGPGGTGKTRLTLQVARGLTDQFPDGVYFVPLAETTEVTLAVSRIAQVLEVREGNNRPLIENLKDYLRDKVLLLVLDNLEQLVDAASMIADLLLASPRLKLLSSSRIILHIRGEQEFPVSPMKTLDPGDLPPLDQLQENESIKLFVQRARSVRPDFALTNDNASAVAEICRRLDGLPLAIELAAARVKLLQPPAMAARLNDRLALLTGGARDLPLRQQTLRNTLDWSFDLLNLQEKTLFARLSIFVGGFDLDAAEAICNLDGALDVLTNVESLLNNSLLRQEETAAGQTRFGMLETVREYALQELEKQGELQTLRHDHALFFMSRVSDEMGFRLVSAESLAWLAWLETEHDNIRAALAWALSASDLTPFRSSLFSLLSWFWYRRGYLSEGRQWTERFLATPLAAPGTLGRAAIQLASSVLALWQGNAKTAFSEAEECLSTVRREEDEGLMPFALLNLGVIGINMGRDAVAYPLMRESSALFEERRIRFFHGVSLVHLGNISLGLGNPAEARQWLEKALSILQEVGDKWGISFALNNFGEVARVQGDYSEARIYYEQSEALLRQMGDQGDLARLVHNLAYIARHEGDLDGSRRLFSESLDMFKKFGNKRGMAECLMGLSGIKAEEGRPEQAARLFSAAEEILAECGTAWWPADRGEVARNRALILSKLAKPAFQAEYALGRQLPLEQKLAMAVDGN